MLSYKPLPLTCLDNLLVSGSGLVFSQETLFLYSSRTSSSQIVTHFCSVKSSESWKHLFCHSEHASAWSPRKGQAKQVPGYLWILHKQQNSVYEALYKHHKKKYKVTYFKLWANKKQGLTLNQSVKDFENKEKLLVIKIKEVVLTGTRHKREMTAHLQLLQTKSTTVLKYGLGKDIKNLNL